jgi:hypothetical protein
MNSGKPFAHQAKAHAISVTIQMHSETANAISKTSGFMIDLWRDRLLVASVMAFSHGWG